MQAHVDTNPMSWIYEALRHQRHDESYWHRRRYAGPTLDRLSAIIATANGHRGTFAYQRDNDQARLCVDGRPTKYAFSLACVQTGDVRALVELADDLVTAYVDRREVPDAR